MNNTLPNEKMYNLSTIILGILGIVISLIAGAYESAFVIVGLMLINFSLTITRYYALVAYALYVFTNISVDANALFSIMIYGSIVYRMYYEWDSSGKTIRFLHLDAYSSQLYSILMFVIILVNALFYLVESGFNVSLLFSFPVMYSLFHSTLLFLAIYMISQRIYEASYFYFGFLILNIMAVIFTSFSLLLFEISVQQLFSGILVLSLIPIIKIILTVLFILKYK